MSQEELQIECLKKRKINEKNGQSSSNMLSLRARVQVRSHFDERRKRLIGITQDAEIQKNLGWACIKYTGNENQLTTMKRTNVYNL